LTKPFKEKIKNTTIWSDFNKSVIIKGFLAACALFSPIVFTALGVESKFFFTVLAPFAFAPFFLFARKELFWFGAFSGVLWFYWIGFSLQYYNLIWLLPFLIFALFFYYGALFWIIGFFSGKLFWLRIGVIAFIFDLLAPLGFDWLRPEMLYVDSYFGASKLDMLLFLCAIAIIVESRKWFKSLSLLFFIFALTLQVDSKKSLPNLKIELVKTNIDQNDKWNDAFKLKITKDNLSYIDNAVKNNADLVVLPETAFPYFLNESPEIIELLKERSFYIPILTGSLKLHNNMIYNSSYFFKNGEMQIFDKVVAVPFGEVNPLPKFMSKIVNDLFFDGAEDYKTADKPSDFDVKGTLFRNAICYEATNETIYADRPKIVIATSNNAWFMPSLEPVMQKMLMAHISKKFDVVIFHTANKSASFILH